MNARPNEDGSMGVGSGGEGLGPDVGFEAAEPAVNTGLADPQTTTTRLRRSRHLLRMSESAPALSSIYSRGALRRSIGQVSWRFQWRCVTGSFTGVELRLRLGDADVLVGLETLATFGAAGDLGAGVPAALHVAYLTGLGADVWQELENTTQRPVQVLGVRLDATLEVSAECLGFEIGREPDGAVSRGFLQLIDADSSRNAQVERLVLEVSGREMPAAPVRTDLPMLWSAVVGHSRVTVAEVQGLEEHDIVILDDCRPTSNLLNCRLCVGSTRRPAGRVQWRNGGKLQMVEYTGMGESKVSAQIETGANPEVGFEDIPVNLRFELAQWTASLGEIGSLAPGAVLELGQRLDDHTVSIWVEQRCIGKGQLVAIGERLGVRLLSVFAREHV